MQASPDNIADVTKAIQLALAPVFLLTGIAGLLNVMAGRLARIVDRGRALTERQDISMKPGLDFFHQELHCLRRRRHFTSIAITACTIAALLLCITIATLFLEVMLHARLSWLIGSLFIGSTMALVVSLAFFLREVHLAMQSGGFRIPAPKADSRNE
jgi:hypothetical protein